MLTTPAIGELLILIGIVLFVVALHVKGHGLLSAAGLVTLLAGALALLWTGVLYSGALFGVLVVVTVLMGDVLFGLLGSLRASRGRPALTDKEVMVGEVGTVRSPVGTDSEGCSFTGSSGGPYWRSPRRRLIPETANGWSGWGRRVRRVGFCEVGVVQVVPIGLPGSGRELDRPG